MRTSTSIRARADLNQFPFAAHLVSWKRPFPTETWHLMAAHGLIRVSSSACVRLQNAQTVILPAHQFACVPFRSCKHALHIVVRNQSAMDMFKCDCAIHVHFVVLTSRTCQSSLARALLPSIVPCHQSFGCVSHQERSTSSSAHAITCYHTCLHVHRWNTPPQLDTQRFGELPPV